MASWAVALDALRASGRFLLVHEEEYEDEPMSVGPVVDVREAVVRVRYVDAAGTWEDEPTEIALSDVTRVDFDDRYSSVFRRYAGSSPPAI